MKHGRISYELCSGTDDDVVDEGAETVEDEMEVKSGTITNIIKNGTKSVLVFRPQPLLDLPDISAWE